MTSIPLGLHYTAGIWQLLLGLHGNLRGLRTRYINLDKPESSALTNTAAKICAPRSLLLKNLHFYSPTNVHKVTKWRLRGTGRPLLKYHRKWLSFFVVLSGRSCRVIWTVSHKASGMTWVGGGAITSELLTDSLSASRFTSSSGESRCVTGSLKCWPFTSSHLPVFIASCFHSNVGASEDAHTRLVTWQEVSPWYFSFVWDGESVESGQTHLS